tara:strand:+ start:562 stop:759 length:198 start_codon:yes stop_codon:yes gene_type:complete
MKKKIERRNKFDENTLKWEECTLENLVRYYFDDGVDKNKAMEILNNAGVLINRFGTEWRIKEGSK